MKADTESLYTALCDHYRAVLCRGGRQRRASKEKRATRTNFEMETGR